MIRSRVAHVLPRDPQHRLSRDAARLVGARAARRRARSSGSPNAAIRARGRPARRSSAPRATTRASTRGDRADVSIDAAGRAVDSRASSTRTRIPSGSATAARRSAGGSPARATRRSRPRAAGSTPRSARRARERDAELRETRSSRRLAAMLRARDDDGRGEVRLRPDGRRTSSARSSSSRELGRESRTCRASSRRSSPRTRSLPSSGRTAREWVRIVAEEIVPRVAARGARAVLRRLLRGGRLHRARSRGASSRRRGAPAWACASTPTSSPGRAARCLAAELRAASADHLLFIGAEEIAALAQAGTVAVILPGHRLVDALAAGARARR